MWIVLYIVGIHDFITLIEIKVEAKAKLGKLPQQI